jgi:hypothetical protein
VAAPVAGLAASTVTCKPGKARRGKVRITCRIKLVNPSATAAATARVEARGRALKRTKPRFKKGRAAFAAVVRSRGRYTVTVVLGRGVGAVEFERVLKLR